MERCILSKIAILLMAFTLSGCASLTGSAANITPERNTAGNYTTGLWQGSTSTIWNKLQQTPPSRLAELQKNTADATQLAWLQLALISKQKNLNSPQLATALSQWRTQHPAHPGNQLLPHDDTLIELQTINPPQQIAILLPQNGAFSASGQAVREGFLNAYYGNASRSKQRIKFYDTSNTSNLPELYAKAITEGADFVIGPLVKNNVRQLQDSKAITVPTLALNYTDGSSHINFYEFGLLPEDEAAQIVNQARNAGQSRALVIAPQNAWGHRLVSSFNTRWQAANGKIQDVWYYTSQATFNQEIAQILRVNPNARTQGVDTKETRIKLRRQDFDVVFLFAQPPEARVIVPLLRYYYVNEVPIYATSSVYAGRPDPAKDVDLNGVIVCDIPWSATSNDGLASSDRLYAVGQDAYRVSQSMPRLVKLSNFPLYGATGALSLSASHQIHRRLPCMMVRNGIL